MGATGTNVFLYEITIFHGYQWVPMGTKSQGVMGTTGINAFNFHSDIEYVCVCVWGGVYNGYHGYRRVFEGFPFICLSTHPIFPYLTFDILSRPL